MRGTFGVVTALLVLVASASVSGAASDSVKCDNAKVLAAAKLFKGILVCNHKAYADSSFDLTECRTDAYLKCVSQFDRADLIYGNACVFTGNAGPSCQETLDAANTIFNGI